MMPWILGQAARVRWGSGEGEWRERIRYSEWIPSIEQGQALEAALAHACGRHRLGDVPHPPHPLLASLAWLAIVGLESTRQRRGKNLR